MRLVNITSDTSELEIFQDMSETQLKTIYEPELGLFMAESPNVIIRAINDGYEPVAMLVEKDVFEGCVELREVVTDSDIDVYIASGDEVKSIRGFEMTRGALCAMRRRPMLDVSGVCAGKRRIAILEDVMNPTNVGAIFRSAAALNVDAVILTKGCSDPLYRRAARVSVGNVFNVPWTYTEDIIATLEALKQDGYVSVAMALDDRAISISDERLAKVDKMVILLGTEGYGLHKTTITACDYTVMIPMANDVDSLNVAAASAVAFWELCNK